MLVMGGVREGGTALVLRSVLDGHALRVGGVCLLLLYDSLCLTYLLVLNVVKNL